MQYSEFFIKVNLATSHVDIKVSKELNKSFKKIIGSIFNTEKCFCTINVEISQHIYYNSPLLEFLIIKSFIV